MTIILFIKTGGYLLFKVDKGDLCFSSNEVARSCRQYFYELLFERFFDFMTYFLVFLPIIQCLLSMKTKTPMLQSPTYLSLVFKQTLTN